MMNMHKYAHNMHEYAHICSEYAQNMQWYAKIRNSVHKNITYTYFGVKLSGTVGRVGNVLSFMPKVLGSNPAWPSCIFCILLHILAYFACV
jgi:hypothetical protein